jgi:biotin carboxyl carrier protein
MADRAVGLEFEYRVQVLYRVALDPSPTASPVGVDLTELPNGDFEADVNGKRIHVDVAAVGPHLSVRIEGRIVDLTVSGQLPNLTVVVPGFRAKVSVQTGGRATAEAARKDVGPQQMTVRAPMPGRVIRVHVSVGMRVEPGQALLVLEAMKMENEVRAASGGSVVAVHVISGATVEANAPLVTLS